MKAVVIQTTVPDEETGSRIAGEILAEGCGACVWVLPPMKAHFSWKGKVETETEHLVVVKTLETRAAKAEEVIAQIHPYDCPEIMRFSPDVVAEGYLKWMGEVVR